MGAFTLKLNGKHAQERGLVALIDEADAALVDGYAWTAQKYRSAEGRYYFYATAKVGGKNTLLHRFILGAKKGQLVDHQDHDTLNCQRYNIRVCTHAQNMMNRKAFRQNKLGVKGVIFDEITGLFRAQIKVDKKCIFLGRHKTLELAKAAYDKAAAEFHGEFART